MARSSLLALGCTAWLCAACDGEFVSLGSSDEMLGGAGTIGVAGAPSVRIWDVSTQPLLVQREGLLLASPSITRTGELFLSSQKRGTQSDDDPSPGEPNPVSVARSLPSGAGFADPMVLSFADGKPRDLASPAISPDGTELWFGLNVKDYHTDIFHSTLQAGVLGAPQPVVELSSSSDDVPRQPALGGTLMPISSKRHGDTHYQIYFAQRSAPGDAWGAPSQELLQAVNKPGVQTADGFVSANGLQLYFSSGPSSNASDLYVARRADVSAAFGAPEPLTDFNTESDERMPWLSEDGSRLYFVSNRATQQFEQYALYVAQRL